MICCDLGPIDVRYLFFLKFWGFPLILGFPKISSPNFPKFPQIHFGRSLLRLRDLGARLRIAFYASEKLFLACLEYVPGAQLHKTYTKSDFGESKISGISPKSGEIPKFWGNPQSLGESPKFGEFPKVWGNPQNLGNVRNLQNAANLR